MSFDLNADFEKLLPSEPAPEIPKDFSHIPGHVDALISQIAQIKGKLLQNLEVDDPNGQEIIATLHIIKDFVELYSHTYTHSDVSQDSDFITLRALSSDINQGITHLRASLCSSFQAASDNRKNDAMLYDSYLEDTLTLWQMHMSHDTDTYIPERITRSCSALMESVQNLADFPRITDCIKDLQQGVDDLEDRAGLNHDILLANAEAIRRTRSQLQFIESKIGSKKRPNGPGH